MYYILCFYTDVTFRKFALKIDFCCKNNIHYYLSVLQYSHRLKLYDEKGKSMIRKIIKIDEEKCNGCGICATACHEGAIDIVDGKAKLMREHYCDGLGDCLPACPTGAISFEEREAPAYDEQAVLKAKQAQAEAEKPLPCGCPGTHARALKHERHDEECSCHDHDHESGHAEIRSELSQWPVQIKLVPTSAPWFDGANLLVAADCTAYAYGDFHNKFIKNRITLIGCPKLDSVDYTEKLTEIIRNNDIKSVTVVRMEVPCCTGIENAVKTALQNSGKFIPWHVAIVSVDGQLTEM